jgi:hypothetical protein
MAMVASSSVGGGRPASPNGKSEKRDCRWKPSSTSVIESDGGVYTILPCWRHHLCILHFLTRATLRETLDPGIPDRTMAALSASLSLMGALFWKRRLDGRGKRGRVGCDTSPTYP